MSHLCTLTSESLPDHNILDKIKLKAYADDKLNVAKKMISVFDRIENIVRKRRKCWLPAFSPLPTVFSMGSPL